MLQQTSVARVTPRYGEFLRAFPSFRTLANATVQQVISTWKGLGYNRRALSLRESARQIASDFHGRLPRTVDELVKLPGVGRATASAVIVYAFDDAVRIHRDEHPTGLPSSLFPGPGERCRFPGRTAGRKGAGQGTATGVVLRADGLRDCAGSRKAERQSQEQRVQGAVAIRRIDAAAARQDSFCAHGKARCDAASDHVTPRPPTRGWVTRLSSSSRRGSSAPREAATLSGSRRR